MTKVKLRQGIFPGGGTPTEYVREFYKRKNIIVPKKDEVVVQSTDNSFNLTIPIEATTSVISKIDYPKSLLDEIQIFYSNTIAGLYGEEALLKVREMTIKLFIIFLDEYDLSAQESIKEVNENIQVQESKTKSNKDLRSLVLEYREVRDRILNIYKYFYKTKDSIGNTWGSSEAFYRNQIKTISIKSSINDSTSASKDGFTLNETYFLFLNDGVTDVPLTYTATSSLALDKGIITINTLNL